MAIFSKLKELGEGVNKFAEDVGKNTVDDYGQPAYFLYTQKNIADIHQRIDVLDEQGNLKYYTKSNFISIKGKTDIMDENDKVIAHLEKKPISLHEKHYITMADGKNFTLSNELFHMVKDITNIEELGWQIRGNILGLSFNLVDEYEEPIAMVNKKMLSIHDKFTIGIYQPKFESIVVAIIIQLEKMLETRAQNSSSSDSSYDNE